MAEAETTCTLFSSSSSSSSFSSSSLHLPLLTLMTPPSFSSSNSNLPSSLFSSLPLFKPLSLSLSLSFSCYSLGKGPKFLAFWDDFLTLLYPNLCLSFFTRFEVFFFCWFWYLGVLKFWFLWFSNWNLNLFFFLFCDFNFLLELGLLSERLWFCWILVGFGEF